MKIPRKERQAAEIPQASLSDISFLLLVFFLSTTTFDIKKGLGLLLPAASSQADIQVKLDKKNLCRILINAAGEVNIDKEITGMNKIENLVRTKIKDNPDMVFSLKTDRRSKYSYMVQVLDKLRLAGAEKISLSTN